MSARILAVVGPTCTGKTRLAVQVAQRHQPAELLNADSRQLRIGARVATFAPTPEELHGVPCHLLHLAAPGAPFSVADWAAAARPALQDVQGRGALPIVVGGSGLYVRALLSGLDFGAAPPDPKLRRERTARAETPGGLSALVEELLALDPDAAAQVDLRNPRRVIRALEIVDANPQGLMAARRNAPLEGVARIGLDAAPHEHARWIRQRVESIFLSGAVQSEVRDLLARGVQPEAIVESGIGYVEALALIRGEVSQDQAVETTIRRTIRYARTQRTWFRREPDVHWLRVDELSEPALLDAALEWLDCSGDTQD